MRIVLKVLVRIMGIEQKDFILQMEREFPPRPADLIFSINGFLDKVVAEINLMLWQATALEGYNRAADIYVLVDNDEVFFSTICVPKKQVTLNEMQNSNRKIEHELEDFWVKSREKIAIWIIASQKFIKQ